MEDIGFTFNVKDVREWEKRNQGLIFLNVSLLLKVLQMSPLIIPIDPF